MTYGEESSQLEQARLWLWSESARCFTTHLLQGLKCYYMLDTLHLQYLYPVACLFYRECCVFSLLQFGMCERGGAEGGFPCTPHGTTFE